jgi:hypothetical protein
VSRVLLRDQPRKGPAITEDTVTELPASIQGEQQQEHRRQKASETDVDKYVDRVSDEVLACRERGRHLFPTTREAGITFTGLDENGLFLRRLTCSCCGLAVKIEQWHGSTRRGRRTRFERLGSRLEYRTGPSGETYLASSGKGHITPRQIGDSIASKALAGQSLAALRKAAARAGGEGSAGSSNDRNAGRSPTAEDTSETERGSDEGQANEGHAAAHASTDVAPRSAGAAMTITVDGRPYGLTATAEPGAYEVTEAGVVIGSVHRRVSASGKTVTWQPWTTEPQASIPGPAQPSRTKAAHVVITQHRQAAPTPAG